LKLHAKHINFYITFTIQCHVTMEDLWLWCNIQASFPGLLTVQFLVACSTQKQRGKAWSILSREWRQCLPR